MSLIFHKSLFGVFDIILAIAGVAAGAYFYTRTQRRKISHAKVIRTSPQRSIRRVYSKSKSRSTESNEVSEKKSGRKSVKSAATVFTPECKLRLRTPSIQTARVDSQYQSLTPAPKPESDKHDSQSEQNPDSPDN